MLVIAVYVATEFGFLGCGIGGHVDYLWFFDATEESADVARSRP